MIITGDSLQELKQLPPNSIDAWERENTLDV